MYAATPWLTERHGYDPTYGEIKTPISKKITDYFGYYCICTI
ncbi:hypothetical protein PTB13_02440 [Bacillus sp. MHSD17]|nr:hypothetical protein [Bacillus sp. MHSD17]